MRKILALTICSFCLCVPLTVQADDNVTNQLEEIIVQLDNLDQVIQFFLDNKENLEWWIDDGLWNDHLQGVLPVISTRLNLIRAAVDKGVKDIASIKEEVAALSADLAGYVSQIVASVNGVSAEVEDLHQWLISIDFSRIQHILTQSQLDESLGNFISQLDNNSYILAQILQSIQSLDNNVEIQDALDDIVSALNQLGNITVYVDLVEELENMDLHFDLDLDTALSGLEGDLSSVLSVLNYFLSEFQHFYTVFVSLQNDEAVTNLNIREFLSWYKDYFFPGLRKVLSAQSLWLERQEAIETAESEYREKRDVFFADDAEFPTGPDVDYVTQTVLKEVELEEPEVPDEKIYRASDKVESDLEEVEGEITGAMDVVDNSVKAFLNDINIRWGSFNSVLSFSFTPPVLGSKYTMTFSYDFSKSELLPPCRAASTGVWAIVLFMESFLAISRTFHVIVEN